MRTKILPLLVVVIEACLVAYRLMEKRKNHRKEVKA